MKKSWDSSKQRCQIFSLMNNRVTSGDVDLSEEMVNIDVNTLYTVY